MRITLVRHGVTEWNALGRWQGHADTPLSPDGERQARLLGRRLANEDFDLVYTSDLVRARRTAELALPHRPATPDARLREVHFGEFDGQNIETNRLHPLFAAWTETPWSTPAPGGESFADVARRGQGWLDDLPDDANVAAFAHSLLIRTLVSVLLGVRIEARAGWTFPFPLTLRHASITRLARHEGEWSLETFSDAAHLEPWAAELLRD